MQNKSVRELKEDISTLFCAICNMYPHLAWKARKSELEDLELNEFIAGISTPLGQATFHINTEYWDRFKVSEVESEYISQFCDSYSTEEGAIRVLSFANNMRTINDIVEAKEKSKKKIKK